MAKKLTATEKLARKKEPKKVRLERDFAGIKAGQRMYVATPQIVDEYIRKVSYGDTVTVPGMRDELAKQHDCDATCPVSTAIFVRMSAEAALEQMGEGKAIEDVTPFWRVIESKDKITGKLNIEPEWVDMQRRLETS